MADQTAENWEKSWSQLAEQQWDNFLNVSGPAPTPLCKFGTEAAKHRVGNSPINMLYEQTSAHAFDHIELASSADYLQPGDRVFLRLKETPKTLDFPGFSVTASRGFLDLGSSVLTERIAQSSTVTPLMWRRILSWLASDIELEQFVNFLSDEVFSHFAPPVCSELWLCLEPTRFGEQSFCPQPLVGFDPTALVSHDALKSTMTQHLKSLRCRVLWYRLSETFKRVEGAKPDALLSDADLQGIRRWRQLELVDWINLQLSRSWYQINGIREPLEFKGLNIGKIREYDSFCFFQMHQAQAQGN